MRVDEPTPLRWLRVVDEHPLRCGLATALLGLGFELVWRTRSGATRVETLVSASSTALTAGESPSGASSCAGADGPRPA